MEYHGGKTRKSRSRKNKRGGAPNKSRSRSTASISNTKSAAPKHSIYENMHPIGSYINLSKADQHEVRLHNKEQSARAKEVSNSLAYKQRVASTRVERMAKKYIEDTKRYERIMARIKQQGEGFLPQKNLNFKLEYERKK